MVFVAALEVMLRRARPQPYWLYRQSPSNLSQDRDWYFLLNTSLVLSTHTRMSVVYSYSYHLMTKHLMFLYLMSLPRLTSLSPPSILPWEAGSASSGCDFPLGRGPAETASVYRLYQAGLCWSIRAAGKYRITMELTITEQSFLDTYIVIRQFDPLNFTSKR